MNIDLLVAILMTIAGAATPLLIAALGELVVEKSGVLNLGVEGMMLIGAVTGFAIAVSTGIPALGALGAMVASLLLSWTLMVIPAYLAISVYGWGLYVAWTFVCAYIVIMGFVFLFRFRGQDFVRPLYFHKIC